MRLIVGQTQQSAGTHVFRVDGETATDLTAALPAIGADLAALTEDATLAREAATVAAGDIALTGITPALPLDSPGKVVCLGLNYVEHAKEGGYEVPDYPAMFVRVRSSLIASGEPLVRPNVSETLDYEAELMVILGKGGRHISEADALDHVFGYTTFNDGSVRVYQRKTHQWTAGKNFDGTGSIGPITVTADDLPAGAKELNIQTRLNGRVLQNSNTTNMIFSTAQTISILSEIMTLEPGDMIALGTPPGVGHARKPQVWMRPGDTVEVEIENIGICSNPIVAEDDILSEAAE